MVLLLIAHLSLLDLGRAPFFDFIVLDLLGALTLFLGISMACHAPRLRFLPENIEQPGRVS